VREGTVTPGGYKEGEDIEKKSSKRKREARDEKLSIDGMKGVDIDRY